MKKFEQILARRRQVVVSIAKTGSMIREEEYTVPTIEPTAQSLEAAS